MTSSEKYEYLEEDDTSFIANIRRNLNVVTINEYFMLTLVAVAILLMSGIVFVLAKAPQLYASDIYGTRIIFYQIVPSNQAQNGVKYNPNGLTHQYVVEMLVVASVIAIGVYGLYLMKNATSYIDDQRKALAVLMIGTTVFSFAAATLFFIYIYKMTGNFPSFVGLG